MYNKYVDSYIKNNNYFKKIFKKCITIINYVE